MESTFPKDKATLPSLPMECRSQPLAGVSGQSTPPAPTQYAMRPDAVTILDSPKRQPIAVVLITRAKQIPTHLEFRKLEK